MDEDAMVRPFRIGVPGPDLDDLRRRLATVRLPRELDETSWSRGVTVEAMGELLVRWRDGYDWRAEEAELNRFPQVVTEVDGQRLHAVHRPSPRQDAHPLVLLHGWPSTVAEFRYVIDELAEPDDPARPAFHVVVPSLPGFGFSGPLREGGWGAHRMARAIDELLRRLGINRYLAHGGDAGYQVAAALGRVAPERVAGVHLNLGGVGLAGRHRTDEPADEQEALALRRYAEYVQDGSAYALLNATRPQTVAYGLADSPIGQLAWIAEKFMAWADAASPVAQDDVLTTASIYWFTETAASSARFYGEEYTPNRPPGTGPALERTYVDVPTAVSSFPGEIVPPIRRWAEEHYRIVRWTEHPAGGHFSALERPDLLVEALRGFAAQVAPSVA
ncbi:pimeloyl-ACP methyl ester carboxylesterase [Prauserella sediminis]|uniref:Pimeloyl-ACP methyl ester carboxylesterase n=1 Tax=Prauserella sediminis TaxID=577680 RepID=A0A839XNZ1_9PSEU|nr:epoxide hydrolase family protein [Prauserella sediminis]MBB3665562.1 pimeloyl-ACP methyl ester carboxylesterase [Prauserella sediminis]